MQNWKRTRAYALLVPGGILLLGAALMAQAKGIALPPQSITFLYYSALLIGLLLAWRFHSSRICLAITVVFLASQAIGISEAAGHISRMTPVLAFICVLLPLDFIVIAMMDERGFQISALAPVAIFLFLQLVFITVLASGMGPKARHAGTEPLPNYILVTFLAAGLILLSRGLITRKPVDHALFWSFTACLLFIQFRSSPRISSVYVLASLVILAFSVVETSYLLAYHDELTGLPSRRAFNEALSHLQEPYSIAAVDIDRFKQFNDAYGHDVGDQVLRLVATKLGRVTGGGQAYRCGGEEFVILFPGKTCDGIAEDLEHLRSAVETAEFRMREADRREVLRGPERRKPAHGRARKVQQIRKLARGIDKSPLSVTVSIGVAGSSAARRTPDSILQAADKALYRAKANGRNRVELATLPRRRDRAKAGSA